MVVRKETQQTGVKVNQPAQRNVPHGIRALSAILAMVMTMALMLLYAPTPHAKAEETQETQSGAMLSIDSSNTRRVLQPYIAAHKKGAAIRRGKKPPDCSSSFIQLFSYEVIRLIAR